MGYVHDVSYRARRRRRGCLTSLGENGQCQNGCVRCQGCSLLLVPVVTLAAVAAAVAAVVAQTCLKKKVFLKAKET